MAETTLPNIGLLGEYDDGDAWGDGMRKNLRTLTTFVQGLVKDKDLTSPPGAPVVGDAYIIAGASPTGAWSGWADRVVVYNGTGWDNYVARQGWSFFVDDENRFYVLDGADWVKYYDYMQIGMPYEWQMACTPEDGAIAGGLLLTVRVPADFELLEARASLVVPDSEDVIVDIDKDGANVLSTPITIDAGDKTSVGATSPPVISITDFHDDEEVQVSCVDSGAGDGRGLKVLLKGVRRAYS